LRRVRSSRCGRCPPSPVVTCCAMLQHNVLCCNMLRRAAAQRAVLQQHNVLCCNDTMCCVAPRCRALHVERWARKMSSVARAPTEAATEVPFTHTRARTLRRTYTHHAHTHTHTHTSRTHTHHAHTHVHAHTHITHAHKQTDKQAHLEHANRRSLRHLGLCRPHTLLPHDVVHRIQEDVRSHVSGAETNSCSHHACVRARACVFVCGFVRVRARARVFG
jgi:hypothetical protein